MNGRFIFLALVCASPWLYAGGIEIFGPSERQFGGFGGVVFVLLLWLKEWALMSPKERAAAVARDEPHWKMPLYILGSVALVAVAIGMVLIVKWYANESRVGWALRPLAYSFVALLFLWDLRRIHKRIKNAA
jgi:hypothetical protein